MTSISAVEMLEQYQTENDRLRAQLAAMHEALEGARGSLNGLLEGYVNTLEDPLFGGVYAPHVRNVCEPALAAIDAALAGAAKPSPSDTDRLDFMDRLGEIHGGYDYDDGDYVLHQVTGNINDREYKIIGKGVGLREALDNAKKAGTV